MLKEHHSSLRRRGVALSAALTLVGVLTDAAPSISADTSLSSSAAEEYGLDKVTSTIIIEGSVAVIQRTPAIAATIAEAEAKDASRPTLTCKTAAATVTSTGNYVSINDILVMHFAFTSEIDATTDSCTVSKSEYLTSTKDTTYPFTAAGRTALWGDSTKEIDAAKARLDAMTAKLRATFRKSWTAKYTERIAKAIPAYKWSQIDFTFEATSTAKTQMYVVRPGLRTGFWLKICQRMADGVLVCMNYNPVRNKKSFSVDTVNKNLYTETITDEQVAS
jgi:hypothetical protein